MSYHSHYFKVRSNQYWLLFFVLHIGAANLYNSISRLHKGSRSLSLSCMGTMHASVAHLPSSGSTFLTIVVAISSFQAAWWPGRGCLLIPVAKLLLRWLPWYLPGSLSMLPLLPHLALLLQYRHLWALDNDSCINISIIKFIFYNFPFFKSFMLDAFVFRVCIGKCLL